MADTGMEPPTSVAASAESPYDDVNWTNPANATALDNVYADCAPMSSGQYSYILKCKGFDFSVIPVGATIDGVVVSCWAYGVGDAYWYLAQLLDTAGNKTGSDVLTFHWLDASRTEYQAGGASELWGCALTRAWVQDADFGVALGFTASANESEVHVDHVEMTVYYTEGSGGAKTVSVGYFGRTQI
jgi:hypothetical protein